MSRPFRWDITKREQLGRLVDGPAAEAYPEFITDLRRYCARILAFCEDSDLFFLGRSPENIFDYLSGLLADTSWAERLTLFNVSTVGAAFTAPTAAQLAGIREQLSEAGMSPAQIVSRPRPVALVDIISTGTSLGYFARLILDWMYECHIDPAMVKRKIRFVGLTKQGKTDPDTWRWQQQVHWARQFSRRTIKNVAIPWRLWNYIGNRQEHVTDGNPYFRWDTEELLQPPREQKHIQALRLALQLYDLGRSREERQRFAAQLSREPAMHKPWYRSLIGEVRFAGPGTRSAFQDRAVLPPPEFHLGPELLSGPPGCLLDAVRAGCRYVAEKAQWVQVNSQFIPAYAATLPLETIARPEHDPASHYLGHGDDTLAFFVTLDSINFGSGYFPHLRKRPGMSGYFTIASSLNEHFQQNGPFSAKALTELCVEDCTRIFGQDPENKRVRELMQHFAKALNDLGWYLLDSMGGSFVSLVESAGHSAERLALLLASNMEYFRDVALYTGVLVPFFKRAQLTAADLTIAFAGQGPGRFDDLDRLTIFADNLVPHVLRMDGVLFYDPWLLTCIDRELDLMSGDDDEIEIRACALYAVELIVQELRKQGRVVNAMQLDYLLWNRGRLPRYKARPRHRAESVYY